MPSIHDLLSQSSAINYTSSSLLVEQTVAGELQKLSTVGATVGHSPALDATKGTVRVAVIVDKGQWKKIHPSFDGTNDWLMARVKDGAGVELLVSRPHPLYGLLCHVVEEWAKLDVKEFLDGKILHPSFPKAPLRR